MIQILHDTNIHFMKYRRYFYVFSAAVVLAIVAWLVVNGGPHYSVDFTGGTLLQMQTAKPIPADEVRKAVDAAGFRGAELQASGKGDEFLIRLRSQNPKVDPFTEIKKALVQLDPTSGPTLRRIEAVGPK